MPKRCCASAGVDLSTHEGYQKAIVGMEMTIRKQARLIAELQAPRDGMVNGADGEHFADDAQRALAATRPLVIDGQE